MPGLIGKKLGMTQIFGEDGAAIPVTVVEVGPCMVVQVRTPERDGYRAVQLGFEALPERKTNKPMAGHFKACGTPAFRHLKEFRVDEGEFEPGQVLKADWFEAGTRVKVTGTSKGRGFQGVVKRHNFSGGPETHGAKTHDEPGSIGNSAYPGRVWKGKKLPGHMGNVTDTTLNLQVVGVDAERNLMWIKGSLPGARGSLLYILRHGQRKGAAVKAEG
jgi:large subunit ribosomal protein L3